MGTKCSEAILPSPLKFRIAEIIHFHKVENILPNVDGRSRLYVPTDPNNPCWDCIYHDGQTVVFIQFSISPFWNGHDNTIGASFD